MPENENLEQEEAVGDEPQYEYVTDPMMLDSTGQDIKDSIDGVSTALAALAGSISPTADNVSFDNTGTNLTSSDVEGAIKEVEVNAKYPLNTQLTFNAPICNKYYGTYQLFIPIHRAGTYTTITVNGVSIYYGSTTPSISNYQVNRTPAGVRIEFSSTTDYTGYLGAAQITFS